MNERPKEVLASYFVHRGVVFGVDDRQQAAVRALATYYRPGQPAGGALFDRIIAATPHDEFVVADVEAAAALGAVVPSRVLGVLSGSEARTLLCEIPAAASVWDTPALLNRGTAAWELRSLLERDAGCRPSTASKLMAAKRPELFPVLDRDVARALGHDAESLWPYWQEIASPGWWVDLRSVLEDIRSRAAGPRHVCHMRIVNVVVWMLQQEARRVRHG